MILMPSSCINDYNINYWTVLLLQQYYSNKVFLSESVAAFSEAKAKEHGQIPKRQFYTGRSWWMR